MTAAVYWRDSWDAALKEAKEANKPLVLELYLEGCPHCMRLDKETHPDQAVATALNTRFIPVRLEGRSHMEIVKQFNVTGRPLPWSFPRMERNCIVFPVFTPSGIPQRAGKIRLRPGCRHKRRVGPPRSCPVLGPLSGQ